MVLAFVGATAFVAMNTSTGAESNDNTEIKLLTMCDVPKELFDAR